MVEREGVRDYRIPTVQVGVKYQRANDTGRRESGNRSLTQVSDFPLGKLKRGCACNGPVRILIITRQRGRSGVCRRPHPARGTRADLSRWERRDPGSLGFARDDTKMSVGRVRIYQPAAAARWRRGVSVGAVSFLARFLGFFDLVCSSLPVNSMIESIAASPRRLPNFITRV